MHTTTDKKLSLSVAEAALVIGVSQRTLEREIKTGSLPSFRIGKRRLIKRSSLEAWIRSQESEQSAAFETNRKEPFE